MSDKNSLKPNRLASEKSPYLLQHAYNPVDWYSWGEEAFAKAAREDKPVFLSIGYSTCHWCHVMERESFEDSKTAQLLNESFVSIKVDREERPDVDGVYMSFVMAATGSGGWPMSVFLTPDQKPFFGGTYFPPVDRFGMPSFRTLLTSIGDAWKTRRDEILKSAESSASFLSKEFSEGPVSALSTETLGQAVRDFAESFDTQNGGFGRAPKFPRSHAISFLLGEAHYSGDTRAREMALKTLTEMARGGLYDHLGGGFHRYSTDALWRVPHFEKMLYDQAQLIRVYLDAFRMTQDPEAARIARETLDYVLRDLTSPEGGFYSAEDADSPDPQDPSIRREGAFYVWTPAEINQLLGAERGAIFCFHFGVEENGNAISDPHGELSGKSVLYAAHSWTETAKKFSIAEDEVVQLIAKAKETLFKQRERRARPHLDDKVLTDWNGLMISALADASRALDEPKYLHAAERAAEFIESHLTDKGKLYHRWRKGEKAIPAFLTDIVFLGLGYLMLYEAGSDERWLERAYALANEALSGFWDEKRGGFYGSAKDSESLIARPKEIYDGAIASGNSSAAHFFYRLWAMTGVHKRRLIADKTLETFSRVIDSSPTQYTQALIALRQSIGPGREVVLAGRGDDPLYKELVRETGFSFSPNQVTLFHRSDRSLDRLKELAAFAANAKPLQGRPTAYVCVEHACRLPVTGRAELRQILEQETSQT